MIPRVAIIILNWNGWKDTLECLESIYQINYPSFDIVVVDNGSKDESVEKIKEYAAGSIKVESNFFKYNPDNKPIYLTEYTQEDLKSNSRKKAEVSKKKDIKELPFKKELILIKNSENYGFAEGNNIAIRFALETLKPDYVLLQNNDTVVDPNFLNELINIAESDSSIGILGPTIFDYKPPSNVQSSGLKILWNKGNTIDLKFEDDLSFSSMEVDAVTGCALLAKSELLNKIGLLNKNYFAYFEDVEWCVRARRAGYKIIYVPKSKIWHKGGATSSKIAGFALYLHTRNRFWFMKRHASHKQHMLFIIYILGFNCFSFAIWAILNRNKPLLTSFLKGIRDGLLSGDLENAGDQLVPFK